VNISSIGKKIDDIEVKISYRIIELFSAGLYSSPNKAFEELICNSYDAYASEVEVYVSSDLSATDAYIWVLDNGEGLDESELKDLWRIGESSKRKNPSKDIARLQIGQFGIGKLATYILARKLTYLTKKNNRYLIAVMDYDVISNDNDAIFIDEIEVTEAEAISLLNPYLKSINKIRMFGKDSVKSWTISILTDLKPKASEITEGRLKWILRTALPLNPNFKLHFNGVLIESSKINIPILKTWTIGLEDQTAESLDWAESREENGEHYVDFSNLKGVNGQFELYSDSLLEGKSADLGRSNGIFLNIRGRLINIDDPLLGMEAFSHGAFNRTRIVINADELDNNLTSTREAVKESRPFSQLKEYIKKKFNNEVKKYYFDKEQTDYQKATVAYRMAQTSYTTSKRPIYSFINKFYSDEICNPFLIEKPKENDKDQLVNAYNIDVETGDQVIEKIIYEPMMPGSPIAKLDLVRRLLKINVMHPYVANYSGAYKTLFPLEGIAIAEVLTEAHMYELGIDENIVNNVMKKRDATFKELAFSDRESTPAVAMLLKDSLSNPTGLENAVYRALLALGFETSQIGGPNKPDGKADAILGYDEFSKSRNYSLTFDAKSTNKKVIAAGTSHLSALKRHQSTYEADYCIEVAIGYQGETDPNSAISVEAIMQKVTVIKASDLVRLMFLATPKQIGLDKLRDLFETCYAPYQVKEWIDNIQNIETEVPPYFDIVDVIYELQKFDSEPPTVSVVRTELNRKLSKKFSSSEVKEQIKILQALVPGCVSLENEFVGTQVKPETIKSRITSLLSNIPYEWTELYNEIFEEEKTS